jgi:hypothetical protein
MEGGVNPCSTECIAIKWEPGAEQPNQSGPILSVKDARRFRVILPADGVFYIDGRLGGMVGEPVLIHRSVEHLVTDSAVDDQDLIFVDEPGVVSFNRKYFARIDESWWGRSFEVPEHGPPIIYVSTDPESSLFG